MTLFPGNRIIRAGLAALLLAALVFYYWPIFGWLAREWLGPGPSGGVARDWSHGLLVTMFIGFLLWRRRDELFAPAPPSQWWVVPLILLAAGLGMAGRSLEAAYLSGYSLIPAAAGLAGMVWGAGAGYRLLPPLTLFVLAVPFPAIEWGVTGFLQNLVATGSAFLAGISGAEVARSGLNISVGEVDYLIAPLCSGFSLILALLSVVLPVLCLKRASIKSLVATLFWVPVLGLGSKIALVSIVLAATPSLGVATALSFYHGWLGVLFFLVSLGIALLIACGSLALWDRRTSSRRVAS